MGQIDLDPIQSGHCVAATPPHDFTETTRHQRVNDIHSFGTPPALLRRMKNKGWKLGRAAGIDVFVHWTFMLLLAWVVLTGGGFSEILLVIAMFACVVLHEYGHALMARHYGIGTKHITLYPIGGVALLERMPRNPRHEIAVALAGPAVNIATAILLVAFMFLTSGLGGAFLFHLFAVNVILAVFNLLPAFPMDGGRVLRAALVKKKGYMEATNVAARVGQYVAMGLAGIALFTLMPTLLLLASFVYVMAGIERRQVAFQQHMNGGFDPYFQPNTPPASAFSGEYQEIDVEVLPPNSQRRSFRFGSH